MIKSGSGQLVHALNNAGFTFSQVTLDSAGRWSPADTDWNYRDIPHLNIIHSQVDNVLAFADTDFTSSLFVQKLGPFRLVLSIVVYSVSENNHVYFTSVGPFVLIIDTVWEKQDLENTLVSTTYNIGSPSFLRPFHFIIKPVLRKNYQLLMAEDLPMRQRRGYLRSKGFTFRQDSEGHSFFDSLKISRKNLIYPQSHSETVRVDLSLVQPDSGLSVEVSSGRGLRLIKDKTCVQVFALSCEHEGADLSTARREKDCLVCPWHGRLVRPIAKIDLISGVSELEQSFVSSVVLEMETLIIELSSGVSDQ